MVGAPLRFALHLSLFAAVTACDRSPHRAQEPAAATIVDSAVAATDDAGREVRLPRPARRVVALLPAITETLFALGAGEQVVGRTRYDTDPQVAHLPSVGGGLDPSLEALLALRPDLVVAFETAGTSKIRPRLEALGIPVFAVQTQDTSDIFRNLHSLGELVGRDAAADSLARAVRAQLAAVRAAPRGRRPSVLFVASVDPPIVAGRGTFVAELLGVAGAEPMTGFGDQPQSWPQVSLEEIVRRQPDVVMLPVGEDPAASLERLRSAPGWRDLRAVREGRVAEVPADLVNRPGPRIGETAERMRAAIGRVWSAR